MEDEIKKPIRLTLKRDSESNPIGEVKEVSSRFSKDFYKTKVTSLLKESSLGSLIRKDLEWDRDGFWGKKSFWDNYGDFITLAVVVGFPVLIVGICLGVFLGRLSL